MRKAYRGRRTVPLVSIGSRLIIQQLRVIMNADTDEGLRQSVREIARTGSWDGRAGQEVLAEIRRRAVRNAAHVAAATGMTTDRSLVDDVASAAWIVLRRCQVCDQGPGIKDPTAGTSPPNPLAGESGGRGLWICRNLAGKLTISTGPDGRGTIIQAVIPR